MFDKVLLIVLILLLPVGIIVSRQFGGQLGVKTSTQNEAKVKNIEDLLTQLNDKAGRPADLPAENQQLIITGVVTASESGVIKVAGAAPFGNHLLWVSYTVVDVSEQIPELKQNKNVSKANLEITQTAQEPQADGTFVIDIPARAKTGILQILIQQDKLSQSLRYDLGLQKQLE